MRTANDELMLIAQIENTDGVKNADRIAAVDGIDALWIGQFDLSTSLGIPGRLDHRLFQEATQTVLRPAESTARRQSWVPQTLMCSLAVPQTDFACSST